MGFARTDIANQITIILPSQLKDGTYANLNLNLSLSVADYLVMQEGLTHLSTVDDDSKLIAALPGLDDLVKWVIIGAGQTDYFDGYVFNTLLPDNDGSACPILENCQVNYDENLGSTQSYDWDWYYITGLYLSLNDGRRWEEEQCFVHRNCIVYEYTNNDYGNGETCIGVLYTDDGTEVDGLYCEVHGEP